jgi:hypothetical protein
MENLDNNPVEDVVVEAPEVVEAPVVDTPVVEEAPVAPAQEEVKAEEPVVISRPSYAGSDTVQAVGSVANGAIGATTAKREPRTESASKAAKVAKDDKTVAIRSTKNVSWAGVGKVSTGINIVSQKEADQWLTRDHITLVTPEQVKSEFGA